MPGHSADIGPAYDPDQARQLLAEAGHARGEDPRFPSLGSLAPRGLEDVGSAGQTVTGIVDRLVRRLVD